MSKIKKSFTLIELIVVIAIIAILAAVIAPNAFKAIKKAQIARTAADMKAIKAALLTFFVDTGKFTGAHYYAPVINILCGDDCIGTEGAIHIASPLMSNDFGVAGWDGPYLDKVIRSPLIHEYVGSGYSSPGTYFIGGTNCYYRRFDFDGDGNVDVPRSVSVQLAGLSEKEAIAIDNVFDRGDGQIGEIGMMNIFLASNNVYYHADLYVGNGPDLCP